MRKELFEGEELVWQRRKADQEAITNESGGAHAHGGTLSRFEQHTVSERVTEN